MQSNIQTSGSWIVISETERSKNVTVCSPFKIKTMDEAITEVLLNRCDEKILCVVNNIRDIPDYLKYFVEKGVPGLIETLVDDWNQGLESLEYVQENVKVKTVNTKQ